MREIRTVVDLVDRMAEAPPDHALVLVDARGRRVRFPWAELHRKVRLHAAWLAAQGIRRGDRVICCPTNDPDVVASFLGLFYLGAIPLSVSGAQLGQAPGSQLPFVADLLHRTGARGVFTQGELVSGNDERQLLAPDALVDFVPSSLDLDEEPPPVERALPRVEELAFVQFSSGSTSRPKGVRITHENAIHNVRLLVEVGRRRPDETAATWLPLYHDMGLLATFLCSLWHCPREMVIMNPIRFLMKPVSWLEEITRIGGRVSICPNFALDLCTDRIAEQQLVERGIDLSSLEMLFVGAEPVRPASLRGFQERFRRFGLGERVLYPVYGLAEATLVVTAPGFGEPIVTREVDGIEVPAVGRPLGDFRVRIVREDGSDAAPGEIGEIWLRGTSVTAGYLDEEENRRLFRDGWLKTGDLGTLDGEGRLYVTGRLKDLIIINGKNYYAHDIVAELEQLPFVEKGKVHVFSVECEGREQMIVLTVPLKKLTPAVRAKIRVFQEFMKRGGPRGWLRKMDTDDLEKWFERLISTDRSELINEIKRYVLARFGVPVHDVLFVPKIPRTTSGKVKRDACERIWLEKREAGPG